MANTSPTGIRVDQVPTAPNVAPTDLLLVLYNSASNSSVANGSPSLRTIEVGNFFSNLVISNSVPANSSANGSPGNFAFDSNYFYVCTSNNVWMRTQLQTW